MQTYQLREDKFEDESNQLHTVFGIDITDNGVVVRMIPNVFYCKEKGQSFVDLCNRLELDPIHIDDVIADALAQI